MTKKPTRRAAPSGPTRACIYRRTSSEKQGERVSPEAQLADCQSLAQSKGYVVTAVYTDIERYRVKGRMVEPSGSRTDRPAFARMLADGRAGAFDLVLAWKEDRLYRGVHPAVLVDDLIEATGITVELARETFDRKMLFIKAAIGRMELDNIRERTEMGMRARVRSGLIHGGPVPAGYVAVKSSADSAAVGYALDPAWRPIFDAIGRAYLARQSLAEICRGLGLDPRSGRPWKPDIIRYIVHNPFYRGLLAYGWQSGHPEFTVPAQHAAAWDAATCAAIERETARRATRRNLPAAGLLSGILRCGICGNLMAAGTTITHTSAGTHKYRVYGCHRPSMVKDGRWYGRRTHEPNYINENRVLKQLRATFAALTPAGIDRYLADAAIALGGVTPDDDQRRAHLAAEIERLGARLADLTVGLDGVRNASPAATETIVSAMTIAGKQLDRARAELATLDTRQRAAPDLAKARQAMLRLAGHPDLFDGPADALQPVLREAFPDLHVRRGKLSPRVEIWAD